MSNTSLRFFLAGVMQGSHVAAVLHEQEYRQRLRALLAEHFPGATIYDPLADHASSLEYDDTTGKAVFLGHNFMCREVDGLIAYVPTASMGTAIEMWEAHQHGVAVVTISPLKHNWAVKFLSHALYHDLDAFAAALKRGEVQQCIERVRERTADA